MFRTHKALWLFVLYLWAAFFHLLQASVFPEWGLFPFSGWIAAAVCSLSWPKALWCAAAAGWTMDLFSDFPFGLHAIGWTLATSFFFRLRSYFLLENPLHWALFSALFSAFFTAASFALLFLFDKRVIFAGKWFFLDGALMPLADGAFALLAMAIPSVWWAAKPRLLSWK